MVKKQAKKATKKAAKKSAPRAATGAPAKTAAKKIAKAGDTRSGLKDHCRSLAGATEDIKWGHDLVFSVGGKMFAAFDLDDEKSMGFKSEEEEFMGLIQIDGIIPAPYLAKHFWVKAERRALPDKEWKRLLTKAHELVLTGLPARTQRGILGQ